MDIRPFAERRTRLIAQLGDGVAVIPTSPEAYRNRDTHYTYRHDSYFYYLTGFREPEALLVLIGGDQPRSVLFCRDRDPEREIWDGFRWGPEQAKEVFALDETFSFKEIEQHLPELLANRDTLYFSLGHQSNWDKRITDTLNILRAKTRQGMRAPATIRDVRVLIDDMRLIKDASEITSMRRAATLSAAAHRRAMIAAAPGVYEYQVEAEILHEFRRAGSQSPAYPCIVAGGRNACILHYIENDQVLKPDELLLIDAGCEIDSYASDITRTFPISGTFTGPQRDVYELVLAAQTAAIDKIAPGNPWDAPDNAAVRVLAQGMIDLKLLSGTVDAVIESGDYKRFYMHKTGHWLGLDVHDAGEYKVDDAWRPLVPGMTLTVEPGCYIRPGDDVPPAFWNIGIRIEDDALVTESGCEILTHEAPKTVAELETFIRESR